MKIRIITLMIIILASLLAVGCRETVGAFGQDESAVIWVADDRSTPPFTTSVTTFKPSFLVWQSGLLGGNQRFDYYLLEDRPLERIGIGFDSDEWRSHLAKLKWWQIPNRVLARAPSVNTTQRAWIV